MKHTHQTENNKLSELSTEELTKEEKNALQLIFPFV